MSGWYCAQCGHRQGAAGTCARDQVPLRQAFGVLGATAGNYTLVDRVGEGGMGEVLRGVNPLLGATVAIKVLHATANPSDTTRFMTEARAANRVAHDGVVKILDGGTLDGGRPYLAMELLDGESLAQRIARAPLAVDQALRVVDQVLDIVGAAHAAGIVHRDLKPANVFLTRSGRTMVLDFGVAKLLDASSSVTRTGSMVGTPGYMAPEQIMARTVDPRTDVYAIGVMLFELLVGRRPFHGDNPFEIVDAHVHAPIPRLPPIHARLQSVVDTALAKDPARRYPSAAAMRVALMTSTGAGPRARKRWPWLVAIALVAAGVTVAAVATGGSSGAPTTASSVAGVSAPPPSAATPPPAESAAPSTPPECAEMLAKLDMLATCEGVDAETRGSSRAAAIAWREAVASVPASATAASCGQRLEALDSIVRSVRCDAGPSTARTDAPDRKPTRRPRKPDASDTPDGVGSKSALPPACEEYLALMARYARCPTMTGSARDSIEQAIRTTRAGLLKGLAASPGNRPALAASCSDDTGALRVTVTQLGCT